MSFTVIIECYGKSGFSSDFNGIIQKCGNNKFTGQFLKGERNGMGILVEKGGKVYFGDFSKNKKNGKGLLYIPPESQIKELPNVALLVGEWDDNKLNGNMRGYDESGNFILSGRYENNLPVDTISLAFDSDKMFSRIENAAGDLYIGETIFGSPEGFGLMLLSNGNIWQSNFKDGMPMGLGLMITQDLGWQTIKFFSDGNATMISSSAEYEAIDSRRKTIQKAAWSNAFSSIADIALYGIRIASGDFNGNTGELPPASLTGTESNETSSSSKPLGGNYQALYSNWERRAKSNYESLTNLGTNLKVNGRDVSGTTGGVGHLSQSNYTLQKRYLREAQKEMSRIRRNAAKAGVVIPQSQWETVSVSY